MKQDKSQWHMWFAWYPVIAEDIDVRQLIWWENVMRRRVLDLDLCDGSYVWQYEPIDSSNLND